MIQGSTAWSLLGVIYHTARALVVGPRIFHILNRGYDSRIYCVVTIGSDISFQCTIIPMYYHTSVLSYQCTIIPVWEAFWSFLLIGKHDSRIYCVVTIGSHLSSLLGVTIIPVYYHTNALSYQCTIIPMCYHTNTLSYLCTLYYIVGGEGREGLEVCWEKQEPHT